MSTITTRAGKGSPLTNNEVDANFTNLNTDKAELSGATFTGEITANAGIALGDNDKATFGASDDLQIYHSGSHSIIADVGTGDLLLRGNNARLQNSDGSQTFVHGFNSGAVELSYSGTKKFQTTSSGIDVTGTATMDGLTVDGSTLLQSTAFDGNIQFTDSGSSNRNVLYLDGSNNVVLATGTTSGARGIDLYTNNSKSLSVAEGGDISFYEDTGTTPKLFWDASAERLGIGTSNPYGLMHWQDSSTINLIGTNSGADGQTDTTVLSLIGQARAYGNNISKLASIDFKTDATNWYMGNITFNVGNSDGTDPSRTPLEAMRIDSAGRVGIGTSSPRSLVNVTGSGSDGGILTLENNSNSLQTNRALGQLDFYSNDGSANGTGVKAKIQAIALNSIGNEVGLTFGTSGTGSATAVEAMRIDSSGNLLVGQTSISQYTNTAGTSLRASGFSTHTRDGGDVLLLNRLTSDGSILQFRKDGTTVGSIGTGSGDLIVGNGSVGIRFNDAISTLVPRTTGDVGSNGAIDLGAATAKFKNLYLSGGVYLGGTGAANKLDDYEEGTWTPTFIGSTSGTMAVTAVVTSKYVKVGTLVTLSVYCTCNGLTHDLSGAVQIASLPFTAVAEMGVGVSPYSGLFTNNDVVVARALGSSLRLVKGSSKANYTNGDVLTNSTVLPFMLTASYHTT